MTATEHQDASSINSRKFSPNISPKIHSKVQNIIDIFLQETGGANVPQLKYYFRFGISKPPLACVLNRMSMPQAPTENLTMGHINLSYGVNFGENFRELTLDLERHLRSKNKQPLGRERSHTVPWSHRKLALARQNGM